MEFTIVSTKFYKIIYHETPENRICVLQYDLMKLQGDLLLESIRDLVRQADIHTGVLMTGIGSLSKARIHTVLTNTNPVEELYLDLDGPLEVSNFNGLIANYEPHLHITMVDPQMKIYAGHLEPGCTILTLAEISILWPIYIKSRAVWLGLGSSPALLDRELGPPHRNRIDIILVPHPVTQSPHLIHRCGCAPRSSGGVWPGRPRQWPGYHIRARQPRHVSSFHPFP